MTVPADVHDAFGLVEEQAQRPRLPAVSARL